MSLDDFPHLFRAFLRVSVQIGDAQRQHSHLSGDMVDQGDHEAVGCTLAKSADEDEGQLRAVRPEVGRGVLQLVERVETVGQHEDEGAVLAVRPKEFYNWGCR